MQVVHWNPRRWDPRSTRPSRLGRRVDNFGDLLGPFLVEALTRGRSTPTSDPADGRLLSIGSILHLAEDGDHIWGTGRQGKAGRELHRFRDLVVHAVRGPRTGAFLRELGVETPEVYGDPALLTPEVVPELRDLAADPVHDLLVVPNLNDYRAMTRSERVGTLDPQSGLWRCVRAVASSRRVVASSLHALVLADALGIPSVPVMSRTEEPFKYHDYYEGTGRALPAMANSLEQGVLTARSPLAPPEPTWDLAPLRASLPDVAPARSEPGE